MNITDEHKRIREIKAGLFAFACPGCDEEHSFNSTWQFNRDFNKPTVRPSILVKSYKLTDESYKAILRGERLPVGERWPGKDVVCHSFITDGKIKFCSDTTHSFANEELILPVVEGGFSNEVKNENRHRPYR